MQLILSCDMLNSETGSQGKKFFWVCVLVMIVVFYCCSGVFCVGFAVVAFSFQNKVLGIYIYIYIYIVWCGSHTWEAGGRWMLVN